MERWCWRAHLDGKVVSESALGSCGVEGKVVLESASWGDDEHSGG